MSLTGVMTRQIEIKSDGDVFHELFRYRPHHITDMSPTNIKGVDLHEGEWGTVGSIFFCNYFHEGKTKVAKHVLEEVDEKNKSLRFKVIGGDMLELYKTIVFTVHVDTKGESNLVTWTIHYEKLNENVEDPNPLMDICINMSKDIESHHLKPRLDEGKKSLICEMVRQTVIKSDGDVFHDIFRNRPHHISDMSPHVNGVNLHDGEWGVVGSIISWDYIVDGKSKLTKEVIEAIDEEKKLVWFKVIEGDLLELYKTFSFIVHVETKGKDNLVTWTFRYEKLNENVEDPNALMDYCIDVTKHIESHHLTKFT